MTDRTRGERLPTGTADGSGLRFGVHSGPQDTSYEGYAALWRRAEDLGLDWMSVFDHFMPIQSDPTGPCLEAFTTLAAMAASTTRLRCGVIVTGVTYRHPAILANMAATIDHVSAGRMELGIGAAWFAGENEMYGIPFPPIGARMTMLEESCEVLRGLWTQDTTTFSGEHFTLRDARCEPKPVQERMPLWVGGEGEKRTLRIVARHATGWNTFFGDSDTYRHKAGVLAGHCADAGRDPADVRRQIVVPAVLGATEAEARERLRERTGATGAEVEQFGPRMIVGTPEACVERLRPYRDLGVEDFLLLARAPYDQATITLFAEQVAPAMRAEPGR